ncbi:hypothetical protein [Erwinia pyrifoliae]|uniref:Uncharacterized protein n=1 Tax=Erwinia pyrifoliae TaxID=79967 RepID=A0ABY5X3M2_ERWPY|nr:hypothetical protein [Erwinia pyrifoliae]AUX72451.1 hypothetical protein CPI84_08155 [Erwinia pyrifoliae]MCA8877297.1 hypothetical protein [Erwinia pyrifoliae]MCT2388757.1 hypothetical protein [Erwinia pyrifoliae]MCU8586926.1 hypothetical protein [Erwinia pyrifoliae]UWS30796.1 hypothetical protein NYP81_04850 [Erwinia pyrifoliae]
MRDKSILDMCCGSRMSNTAKLSPITALPVERDEDGYWTHPDLFVPANGMEFGAPGEFESWKSVNRVTGHLQWMESDATEEQKAAYESGDGDVSQWKPTSPEGGGWFIASIYDTEDGPVCYWLRPVDDLCEKVQKRQGGDNARTSDHI